jgi:hypothetical protein
MPKLAINSWMRGMIESINTRAVSSARTFSAVSKDGDIHHWQN